MWKIRLLNFRTLETTENFIKFVYRAIKLYKELWGVEDMVRSGRPRCARTKVAVIMQREQINRNLLWKQNSLSRELNISPWSMSHPIRDDLHLGAYQRKKGHLLTPALKEIQRTRTEHLLHLSAFIQPNEPVMFPVICTVRQCTEWKAQIRTAAVLAAWLGSRILDRQWGCPSRCDAPATQHKREELRCARGLYNRQHM